MTKLRVRFDSETNFSHFTDMIDAVKDGGTYMVDPGGLSIVFYDAELSDAVRKDAEDLGGTFSEPEELPRR